MLLKKSILFSLILLFILIFAGAMVRVTGSGMGCPDWPKCFGRLMPPIEAKTLPSNYKQTYHDIRLEKAEKLAQTLDLIGLNNLSEDILSHQQNIAIEDFNIYTAWIEYINRLISVLLGIAFLFICFLSAYQYKKNKKLFFLSLLLLLFTLFQAFLGALVVITDLFPGMVSLHLLFTLAILFNLLHMIKNRFTFQNIQKVGMRIKSILGILLLLSLIQIFSGTWVRADIEHLKLNKIFDAHNWTQQLGFSFSFHSLHALLVLAFHLLFFFYMFKLKLKFFYPFLYALMGILLIQIFSGVIMVEFHLEKIAQLLHIVFSFLIISVHYFLFIYR